MVLTADRSWLTLQEVPKTADRGASRCIYLWSASYEHAASRLIDESMEAIVRACCAGACALACTAASCFIPARALLTPRLLCLVMNSTI